MFLLINIYNSFVIEFKHSKAKYIILMFVCFSCNNLPSNVAEYQSDDENKTRSAELLNMITKHYEPGTDSLKIQAAKFLINNMGGLFYREGEQLDNYLKYLELINHDQTKGLYIMKFLNNKYSRFSTSGLMKHNDIDMVQPDDIIENIDIAFKVWNEKPWGKDISFEDFCEYILPFRIGDEVPENNRKEIYEAFNPVLDSIVNAGGSVSEACFVLNEKLKADGWLFSNKIGFLPHFSASTLLKYRTGSCRDMTSMAIFIMRAVGIPVGIDLVPQWPYRNGDHLWNTLRDRKNHVTAFMGADDSPGTRHKPGSKRGKVYRATYAVNLESLAMKKKDGDDIPSFFENPKIKDVTEEYIKAYTAKIPILMVPKRNNKFAYACLFDDRKWKPVHWTRVNSESLIFTKMESEIVYLPAFYGQSGRIIPANYPFILKDNGTEKILKPDSIHRHERMILKRVYSIIPERFQTKNFTGSFEGANKPDFSDAVLLNIIKQAFPYMNTVSLKSAKLFRYVRFVPAKGKHTSLGEFEIYGSGKKLKAELIAPMEQLENDPFKSAPMVIDGDLSTQYESKYSDRSWLGLDLKTACHIDSIRFSVPYDDNKDYRIQSGKEYELLYWDGRSEWVSLGTKKAGNQSEIIFSDVPSNALYIFQNISAKIPGRIFTYQNNKQTWW